MKIGIITYNNALSYGAMIQSFALKKVIEDIGHSVVVLNVECNGNKFVESADDILKASVKNKELLIKRVLRIAIFGLIQKKPLQRKINKFMSFRKCYLYGVNDRSVDLLVCGSDQIWNPDITKGFYDPFFGINANQIPAISYAGSVGDLKNIKSQKDEFFRKIKTFKSISCREKDLKEFLTDNGIKAELVIDPSLLLSKDKYEHLLNINKKIVEDDYIFVFRLGKNDLLTKISNQLAKVMGCKVVELQGSGIPISCKKNRFGDASPVEFLNYIKYAKVIVTDSFHGLALSIVFHKEFYVVLPQKRPERLVNLLRICELENRIIDDNFEITNSPINYNEVDSQIEFWRDKSIKYLEESLHRYE